jgi:Integrase core domain
MAKALRERVGKQYKGTQRTRKAVHGECTVELAKWTFPIISLSREPYEAKVSRTGLTGGMGRRTVRQRALCLPSPLPPRSPNLNAYAERWVRSVKEECLSQLILFGEASLRHALTQYVEHFHHERNHQGKGNVLLFPAVHHAPMHQGLIQCRERLGGLLKYYARDAA